MVDLKKSAYVILIYEWPQKTYLLRGNAPERLQSIPMIQPPPSLSDGPLRDLFKQQEEERYKLRQKHVVEKEKLVLAKGQLISECPFGVIVRTKIPTEKFDKFLP